MSSIVGETDNSPRDILYALGTLVVDVAAMDEALHDAIWLLSGSENRAVHVLTAGMSFRTLVDKFGALCAELDVHSPAHEDVPVFCSHLNGLNDERNAIIHSAWHLRSKGGEHQRFRRAAKSKSGFTMRVTETSARDIFSLAEKFVEAEKKLWEFVP